MRRNLSSDANQFPNDVVELMAYFKGESGRVRAVPGEGLDIPIWILGSSLFGAELAAMLGLPYAFASHFAPQMMMEAIELYRHRFEPSEQLDQPYVMLGFNAIVADTDEEAELLATSQQQAFVALRTGNPASFRRPGLAMPTRCRWNRARSFARSFPFPRSEAPRPPAGSCEEFIARTKPTS